MKIGFLTACLPHLGLKDLVTWAKQTGFGALELAAWPAVSNRDYQAGQIDVTNIGDSEAAAIRELFSEYGLTISALAYYENNLHPDLKLRNTYLDHLKVVIKVAAKLNVKLVGTFVGARPDKSPDQNMKEIGSVFKEITAFAADNGVKIMIENCPMMGWLEFGKPGNYAYSPELWEVLFNEVPSENFGLNFDPSHLYWLGIDYLQAVKDFAPKIFHAHAKDTEFLPEGEYNYGIYGRQIDPTPWETGVWRYRIPGRGEIDWSKIIDTLQQNGYNSFLSIEHEDPVWEGSEEKVKKGLQLGSNHLVQYV